MDMSSIAFDIQEFAHVGHGSFLAAVWDFHKKWLWG